MKQTDLLKLKKATLVFRNFINLHMRDAFCNGTALGDMNMDSLARAEELVDAVSQI